MDDSGQAAPADSGGGDDFLGGGGGGDAAPPPPPDDAPLSEGQKSKKTKILGELGDEKLEFDDLFDSEKAQRNIYEIENKLKDIINE